PPASKSLPPRRRRTLARSWSALWPHPSRAARRARPPQDDGDANMLVLMLGTNLCPRHLEELAHLCASLEGRRSGPVGAPAAILRGPRRARPPQDDGDANMLVLMLGTNLCPRHPEELAHLCASLEGRRSGPVGAPAPSFEGGDRARPGLRLPNALAEQAARADQQDHQQQHETVGVLIGGRD